MMYKFSFFIILMIGMLLSGCKTAESTLTMQNVRNYDPGAASHILFLDFRITGGDGKAEKAELVNVVSGNGKLKNVARPVPNPRQMSVVARYATEHEEVPLVFEHPLHKAVEVASEDGKLSKQDMHAKEGILSVRIQQDNGLEKLELYSITPEKGNIKIYTLNIK